MKNKGTVIATVFVMLTIVAGLMVGCSTAASAPSPSTPRPSLSGNKTSIPTDALQPVLPLKILEPADAADLINDTATVKGQTAPGATVTVNGTADTADSTGSFSFHVSLDPGPNAIDVVAIDEHGQEAEVLIIVNKTAG